MKQLKMNPYQSRLKCHKVAVSASQVSDPATWLFDICQNKVQISMLIGQMVGHWLDVWAGHWTEKTLVHKVIRFCLLVGHQVQPVHAITLSSHEEITDVW